MPHGNDKEIQGIVLAGPQGEEARVCRLAGEEILVGRHDVEGTSSTALFDLSPDLRVSRRHCRLRQSHGKWHIEDLSSKRGTWVGGDPIQGRGLVELVPGTPVLSGDTLWTLLPHDWLLIQSEGVVVSGPYAPAVNHAGYHCRLPVVGPLRAYNITSQRSRPWRLELTIRDCGDSSLTDVPALDPGAGASLGTPEIRLHGELLESCSAPRRAELSLRVPSDRGAGISREVIVLPGWSWSYHPASLRSLAAFTSPDHALIEEIVREAHRRLTTQTDAPSLKALVRFGRKDAAELAFGVLYQHLKEDCAVYWCPPEGERTYQNIVPLDRILHRGATGLEGEATCVDLALMMASCLENVGLLPLIVLTGRENEPPRHAFAGCWTRSLPTGRAILRNREFLHRQTQAGSLLLVECTGFAERVGESGTKLDFAQARRSAETQLANEPQVCAIDIGASRPPYGAITPLSCPFVPVVRQALLEAEQFARDKRRELVETALLLYGCIAARGEILQWLFRETGPDLNEVQEKFAGMIETRSFSGEPTPTQGHRNCLHWAREIASATGAASTGEHHLLWALLIQGRNSDGFRDVCRKLGIKLDRWEELLRGRFAFPAPPTSLG